MPLGIICFEHSVQHSFEEGDLICRPRCRQLGDWIAGGVYEGIDALACDLMISTADFEVKR